MRQVHVTVPFAVSSILLFSSLAFSQSQTGSLSGSVLDANDAAVPGASIAIRESRSGVTANTVSSDAGLYVFPSLPPGIWTVTVEKPGFKQLVRSDIESSLHSVNPSI